MRLRSLAPSVFLPALIYEVGNGAIAPVIALTALSLGASAAEAGVILTLLGVGQILGNVPSSFLVSRLGDRRAMMVAATVATGALLVGYYDGDDFAFAGKIGTGFDTKLLLDMRAQLDQIEIEKAPFTKAKGLPRLRAHWVKPEIVVQAAFIQWTGHGKLRHPRLLSVRTDKDPREVVRE